MEILFGFFGGICAHPRYSVLIFFFHIFVHVLLVTYVTKCEYDDGWALYIPWLIEFAFFVTLVTGF